MNHIHNICHVSLSCKYISDLTYMQKIEDEELKDNLVYKERYVQILDK